MGTAEVHTHALCGMCVYLGLNGKRALSHARDNALLILNIQSYLGGSMTISTNQAAINEHVFLIGHPPISEFLSFVRVMTTNGHAIDQGQLVREWRTANDRVLELEAEERGLADNPSLQPIPDHLLELQRQTLADSIFQRAFQHLPSDLAMVELDRLIVYQKHINLHYVNFLKARLGYHPTEEEVFRLALCTNRDLPPFRSMQTAVNSYSFISPSNDFRFLEVALLDPNQVRDSFATGPVSAVIALKVGFGSNFLNVLHVENRLVLNNGSHRAYALRDLGITHAPCVVQHISRRDELELVGSSDLQQNPDRLLKAPRPPLLKDYFDPRLRQIIPVVQKNRMVKVSFGLEQNDIPSV